MAIELRPLLHLFLFFVTFFAVLWAITSDQLSTCDISSVSTGFPPNNSFVGYTYHSLSISSKDYDSLSRPLFYLSTTYDGGGSSIFGSNDNESVPAYPGSLPEYAKTSYISELLAATFLFFFLVVYLQSQISLFSKILGILSLICVILSAVMATLVNSKADPNELQKIFDEESGSGSGDILTFDSCTLGMSSIMAWIAVGTWTILLLELWRYHKNRNG